MFQFKIVLYFYLGITFLSLFTTRNILFFNLLPGLILMWALFLIFSLPFKFNVKTSSINIEVYPFYLKIFLLFSPVFYFYYIKFYTGQDIFSVLQNLKNGVSNYFIYQKYFNDSELNSLTLNKLPFILGNAFYKFLYITLVFKTFRDTSLKLNLDYITIFIFTIIYILIALARGTSFEFLEILLMFSIAFFNKFKKKAAYNTKLFYYKLVSILSIFLFIFYFIFNIQSRFGDNFESFVSSDFDQNSILNYFSKSLALSVYLLYDYFVFGIEYTSIILQSSTDNFMNLISLFFPNFMFSTSSFVNYNDIVQNKIDIGPRWVPSISSMIYTFGILGISLFIYLLGIFSRFLFKNINVNIFSLVLLFYICMFMISLPIGNFISVSSSNQICIILGVLFLVFKKKVNEL